jgi:hypothetical protein
LLAAYLCVLVTVNMEAICYAETSFSFYRTTLRHIPKRSVLIDFMTLQQAIAPPMGSQITVLTNQSVRRLAAGWSAEISRFEPRKGKSFLNSVP